MRSRFWIILMSVFPLFLWGCIATQTLDLQYLPSKTPQSGPGQVKIAVIPFENATWNGLENPYWVGQAYGTRLYSPTSFSYIVTQGVKKEMGAYGYHLSSDEIYTIQINRHDIKTLLKRVPHIQVDFLIGGVISHFFVQQKVRFIAEVEIEAYLARLPSGDIIWTKKIGHREVRVPFAADNFSSQSQEILNSLLDKTLKDLFWNSDFKLQTLNEKK
jgi:hypothetical protein